MVEGFEIVVKASAKKLVDELTDEIVSRVESLSSKTTAEIRKVRRDFSRRIVQIDPEVVTQVAFKLIAKRQFLLRFIAYELVLHHPVAMSTLDQETVERLGNDIDSWYAVDTFGCYISGVAWREKRISASVIRGWAHSNNVWWRRAAVVSTIPLNNTARGGKGDTKQTLEICNLMIDDREDMVVKALSWSLRELSKKDADAVASFVAKHRERLAPRVIREVKNKLGTGLKNPRSRRS